MFIDLGNGVSGVYKRVCGPVEMVGTEGWTSSPAWRTTGRPTYAEEDIFSLCLLCLRLLKEMHVDGIAESGGQREERRVFPHGDYYGCGGNADMQGLWQDMAKDQARTVSTLTAGVSLSVPSASLSASLSALVSLLVKGTSMKGAERPNVSTVLRQCETAMVEWNNADYTIIVDDDTDKENLPVRMSCPDTQYDESVMRQKTMRRRLQITKKGRISLAAAEGIRSRNSLGLITGCIQRCKRQNEEF